MLLRNLENYFLLLKQRLKSFFNPLSSSGIRRLQYFWTLLLLISLVGLFYGALAIFLGKKPGFQKDTTHKPQPTAIETASKKVDLNEAWRHNVENENKKLFDEISALKILFQEKVKEDKAQEDIRLQEIEARNLQLETELEETKQAAFSPYKEEGSSSPNKEGNSNGDEKIIHKFSLNLTEKSQIKSHKTVETTIPAGTFARTILLSGLDASSAMSASSDPRPMLLRIIDHGTLPRRFQSDLKDCHCLASAYGDLSSERIYARLEKLTCTTRETGEIIETQVAGYIAGPDGKAGIRGIVASKEGQFLGRSLVGGMFAGLSNVANPQNRQQLVNPFSPGSAQVSPPSIGETFTSGMAGGASSALDRLSQYYIDRAEQLQPVIQVAAGQVVDIVFTQGTFIGAQEVHAEIKNEKVPSNQ